MSGQIDKIFKNQKVVHLLELFLADRQRRYYLREIARSLSLSPGAIHADLALLEKIGLVLSVTDGKNKYFQINQGQPFIDHLAGLLGSGRRPNRDADLLTVLFEEHWVSPLTQCVNYFGWEQSATDPEFNTRLGDFAGVYYDNFLKFPFHEASWTERSREINQRLSDPEFCRHNYREFSVVGAKMQIILHSLTREKTIDENFVARLKELYVWGVEACRLGYVGVVADLPTEFLSRRMREIIEKKTATLKLKASVPELVNALSAPPELSLSFRREREFLILVSAVIQKRLSGSRLEEKSRQHYADYFWTDCGHFGTDQTVKNTLKSIIALSKKEKLSRLRQRLSEIDAYTIETKRRKVALYKQLGLSEAEQMIFNSAGLIALVKALRLEYLGGLNSQLARLVTYLSQQHKLEKKLFYFCSFGELISIYENGLPGRLTKLLTERSKFCILKTTPDFFVAKIMSGRQAKSFYAQRVKEIKKEIDDMESFHGSVAYPGKARGRVKVINSPKEMAKMKEGDILVTTQTIPEMLPVMKIAAAFITNSGGITCHAAIVARELKKPCIVGTKIATRILHDGDFVQVDAFRGVVNIIKIN